LGASVTGRIAGGQAVKTQSPTLPYQKQQEELERHRKMLENSKDFTFINLMLRSLGLGEKK
jgi:hypothetical protein